MFATLLRRIKSNKWLVLQLAIFGVLFFYGIELRTRHFDQTSKDITAYTHAINDLLSGINPYEWTIETYSNPDDPTNHGFAYLPGMLYVNAFMMEIGKFTGIEFKYLWKVPVLLADIGIGLFLLKKTRDEHFLVQVLALGLWLFHPYAYFRGGYTYFDPITILSMLVALHYLGRNNALSGFFYALSIATKTFPYLIFPVFLFKLIPATVRQFKDGQRWYKTAAVNFFLPAIGVALLISVPFLNSWENFVTYLRGSVFVHSERFVQGRPFLYYISYYWKIELFRIISFGTYTLLASFSGWVVMSLLYLKKWVLDKYALAVVPFLGFYLFTPVLNRTYLIWFIPLFLLGVLRWLRGRISEKARLVLFCVICVSFYAFYSWYLIQWHDGFHIWHP